MEEILSLTDAAKSLGVTDRTVRNWIKGRSLTASAGGGVAWSEVVRVAKDRHDAALERREPEHFARVIASQLWPWQETETRAGGREDGSIIFERHRSTDAEHAREERKRLHDDADALFGFASVEAAARPLADGCRWCAARTLADHFRTFGPADTAPYRELFASEPCEADRKVFAADADRRRQWRRDQAATTETGKVIRLAALRLAELKAGAPYRLNACGPTAFDCAGLVQWAYFNAGGVDVPRTASALLEAAEHVPVEQAEPGDVLFQAGTPNHVGIFAGDGLVVHATDGVGVTVTALTSSRWDTALRLGVSS